MLRNHAPAKIVTPKLVIKCHNCSGLLVGNICYRHQIQECTNATHAEEMRETAVYRPLSRHDHNQSRLCKWLDCHRCKMQQIMSDSKKGSFLALRLRTVCWGRFTFLLMAKARTRAIILLTSKAPKLDSVTLTLVISFWT
jgi:hypothetical protein